MFSLCSTLFDQGWEKITMYSLEEFVGGNDRDCPCETSFPCTCVCVCVHERLGVCALICKWENRGEKQRER